jgi:hypothetical protein
MFSLHVPVIEIASLIMKLRKNRPFLRIGKMLMLSLVALSAIGCAGDWIREFSLESPACTLGRVPCYHGPPLSLDEFVFQLGGSAYLLIMPLLALFNAQLFLLKRSRIFLPLVITAPLAFFVSASAGPIPNLNYDMGSGAALHMLACGFLTFLSWPLAFDEQLRINPDWDYTKYIPAYMYS